MPNRPAVGSKRYCFLIKTPASRGLQNKKTPRIHKLRDLSHSCPSQPPSRSPSRLFLFHACPSRAGPPSTVCTSAVSSDALGPPLGALPSSRGVPAMDPAPNVVHSSWNGRTLKSRSVKLSCSLLSHCRPCQNPCVRLILDTFSVFSNG